MQKLRHILHHVSVIETKGDLDIEVSHLAFDSRKIETNTLFFAIKGVAVDGHSFIDKAIDQGATVVACSEYPEVLQKNITYILVADTHVTLSRIAANFYDNPSQKLKLIGITGTNGKTTLATLSYKLFQEAGYKVGLISTVDIRIGQKVYPTSHTTPDAITLNKMLAQMVAENISHCFMEVSSHGIDQKRTESLCFSGGVFTNLTHDHLDYHLDFATYRDVKKSFFDHLPKEAFALVNLDDKNGKIMLQNTQATKKTYALKTLADYKAKVLENSVQGLLMLLDKQEVWTKLIGNFNAYNLLAIYAIGVELGLEKLNVLQIISNLDSVDGRFQYFVSSKGVTTIIDYAHTPDALLNVLQTIQEIKKGNSKIITLVGCGGDRDKTKRPKMAHIAAHLSHTAIFTSDNPRSEDPQVIIQEMEQGVLEDEKLKTLSIIDRKEAIKVASKLAQKGDMVLIAGKGHETYQEIKGVRYEFDDFKIAQEVFNQ